MGILILTVFLSLYAPAAYAGTEYPYSVCGRVDYTNGTPADGQLVKIYKAGDPSNGITAEVGLSYGASGCWKADLYNIGGTVADGDTVVFEVLGKSTSFDVDTATGGRQLSYPTSGDDNNGDDNNGGGSGGGGGGGSGTYPPGWGQSAPTPTATQTPTTAAPGPTVTPTSASTEASTEASTGATTEVPTETPTTKVKTEGTPGFGAMLTVFMIAGLLVVTYLVMRRRE